MTNMIVAAVPRLALGSTSRLTYDYHYCQALIARTSTSKNHGVYFDLKLYFQNHVDYGFSECIKLLGVIRYINFRCSSLHSVCVLYASISEMRDRTCLSSVKLHHVY